MLCRHLGINARRTLDFLPTSATICRTLHTLVVFHSQTLGFQAICHFLVATSCARGMDVDSSYFVSFSTQTVVFLRYGGLGCLGTPVVRTDAASIWATGKTWWQVPPIARGMYSKGRKRKTYPRLLFDISVIRLSLCVCLSVSSTHDPLSLSPFFVLSLDRSIDPLFLSLWLCLDPLFLSLTVSRPLDTIFLLTGSWNYVKLFRTWSNTPASNEEQRNCNWPVTSSRLHC